jgi:hypothetical protein
MERRVLKFPAQVRYLGDGIFVATSMTKEAGLIEARGTSRAQAIQTLKKNLQFNLELCPCTPLEEDEIEFLINER